MKQQLQTFAALLVLSQSPVTAAFAGENTLQESTVQALDKEQVKPRTAPSGFFMAQQRGTKPLTKTQAVPMAVMARTQPLRFPVTAPSSDSKPQLASGLSDAGNEGQEMTREQAQQILSIYGESR